MKGYDAVSLLHDLCDIPVDEQYDVFDNDDWDNTSSAFGRGFGTAITQVTDWLAHGGSRGRLEKWMTIVSEWAREVPMSKDSPAALPPSMENWSWNEVVRHQINSHPNRRHHE
jgi:hypothetical protein